MFGTPQFINAGGNLIDLSIPKVMGIINVTADSFYKESRYTSEKEVIETALRMHEEGASIIDIGGYSSRPGAAEIPEETEGERIFPAIRSVLRELPGAIISVDTFRSSIARKAVLECGALIVNDISGGEADTEMFSLISELKIPYILMHMRGTPQTMQKLTDYDDIIADILKWMGSRIVRLHSMGVKDVILDPGFGFSKKIEQNFEMLKRLKEFSVAGLPLLAGLSRKTTVWKTLGITPEEALNGTTVLNTIALMNGADILRVHDVRAAVEAVKLVTAALK